MRASLIPIPARFLVLSDGFTHRIAPNDDVHSHLRARREYLDNANVHS